MEAPETKSLPENAYTPLETGTLYEPLVPALASPPEVSMRSVGWGILFCIVFTVASAYSGLKVGQVMEAAIPISILTIGLARVYKRRSTILENVIVTGIGGVAGAVVAGVVLAIVGRTDDHLIEVALTTVAAYGSFLLAEQFGGSGILATLISGMLLGNLGPRWGFISDVGDRVVRSTWEFITFLANSLVFLLIGLAEGHEDFGGLWWTASAAVVAVLVGRMAAVYPVCGLFSRGRNRVGAAQQHALVWGGLRGALGLALVLSIPESYPWRHPIVVVTFAVVAFSIIIQGLTCRPLLRWACGTEIP